MNCLPKEVEDIIITYKYQLEHRERFSKTLKQIKLLKYTLHCLISNGRFSYKHIFNIDFPIILKYQNTHYDLKTFLVNTLLGTFQEDYEHIMISNIIIKVIEHKGFQVYRSGFSNRERIMTDEYLMDTVYENYK